MLRLRLAGLAIVVLGTSLFGGSNGNARVNVSPDALVHYAQCVDYAKAYYGVYHLERSVLYRCQGDVAVSYFNYLRRIGATEFEGTEVNGTFIYRIIDGVGRCWSQMTPFADGYVSMYGCDIYVAI